MESLCDNDPFQSYKIANHDFLEELGDRSPCPSCNKSRKYYCYTCYIPVKSIEGRLPRVKLPLKIDIIKHSREIDGKSTSSHVAVLAPEDVSIYTYPCIPDYSPEENIVLLYPGKNAVPVAELVKLLREKQNDDTKKKWQTTAGHSPLIHRAVFIDSTWNQSKGLQCVVLENRLSQFWRHQEGSPRWYLATVEAVHEFLVEVFQATNTVEYDGQFDNLLFFFRFMYSKIHELYDSSSLRAYKRPLHVDNVGKKKKVKESIQQSGYSSD
ncbi:tRNA-uridine aminocarboxypropyltransferase 1 isoform X2 [Hetaerina americana]|uniref:tRNA-uridine aminocarboxypropyltransferase 1 isoform X2 n=1 Tax=Hetaerina americana TaxID=62018 RepID=UPI003A7F4833